MKRNNENSQLGLLWSCLGVTAFWAAVIIALVMCCSCQYICPDTKVIERHYDTTVIKEYHYTDSIFTIYRDSFIIEYHTYHKDSIIRYSDKIILSPNIVIVGWTFDSLTKYKVDSLMQNIIYRQY